MTVLIEKAVLFCIEAHKNQYRKSGEPYVVHPLLVAAITAYYSSDESMVLAALLHDVVEDTSYTLDEIQDLFGIDVANIVDGLTKITEIRDTEFTHSQEKDKLLKSAMTFRKMLVASVEDVRVLLVKLFDRTHNMLTLDALSDEKRFRIAEETLVVYAPIAHRLGMSAIKNTLEDLSFFYIYPNEYKKIDDYIKNYQEKIQNTFNLFLEDVKSVLNVEFENKIKIYSRIKHYYSIYLKIQRKGVTIDEVLDLFAIRIITNTPLECYTILGLIHTTYMPLISRFKDYVAIPKENGYQTIHTTVFHNTKIFEVQIRTKDRHKQIDILNGKNIINTIFSRYKDNILEIYPQAKVYKVVENLDHLKHIKRTIETKIRSELGLFARMKVQQVNFKEYAFENLVFQSNFTLSNVSFDHCCHPKLNDEIVAFRNGKDVIVHHKRCENAYSLMKEKNQRVFCKGSDDKYYIYKMVVSLKNVKGELARLLTHLSNHDATILFIEYGKDRHSHIQYCTIDFEIKNNNSDKIKKIVNQKAKIIEFYSGDDAYK
ncbi:MAG: bifunctional (p)ppGpp synthetase/guanosine-3',5'-bis(diphosphate) 3'-pyrophosphohydrolase [Arcobacter sp.]|nr:bifunctional (p)ppGpp synthetase/guanosine-3',5'-bis(diphosphate) 3'-pyrophosphohydrolase [Arcobacter sp.]